jgi:uncharacterized protein (DUF433 family)/DNA-binding transcriptional MerR regulator
MSSVVVEEEPKLGEGIYTFPEASRIIRGASSRQLRSWMQSGLAEASFEADSGRDILAFEDVVSLEVVRRFKGQGVSLQRIRRFDCKLRAEFPGRNRPFAYQGFFTDGADLWISEFGEGHLGTQLTGKRRGHRVWQDAIATFAKEISFDQATKRADRWFLSPWVEIDPEVQFGQPVVRNTRVPVAVVIANLRAGTPAQVADWLGLTTDEVNGTLEYDASARLSA